MIVVCDYCGNAFERSNGRYNEAVKFCWRQYCSSECQRNGKIVRIQAACNNPLCNKSFTRTLSEARGSKLLFCSISCSTSYYNAIRQDCVLLRTCKRVGCNNYIHSTDLKINYCGGKCSRLFRQGLTSYSSESVISIIQSFVAKHDRIPTRNELGYLNRLARRFFGTWNKAIVAAGYDPNPVMFARQCIAKDGHRCDSQAERIVDDWLYRRNIKHAVHVPYPWSNGMKCDFLVGNTWIEIFGLEGELSKYDKLKEIKLTLVKKHKLELISVSLQDVYKNGIEEKLGALIKRDVRQHLSS